MDEQTINTYNVLAKDYDQETSSFWERFPSKIIDKFVESLPIGGRVLDVGCGPGRDGLLLKGRGLEVVCLDASAAMVELCRERGLKAVEGDLLALPFDDQGFDGVWAYTSLLHIKKEQLPQALEEIFRVLKPGGVFGLGMIEGEGEMYRESSGVNQPRWFSFYSKSELETYLVGHGFAVKYFEEFKPGSKKYLNFISEKTKS